MANWKYYKDIFINISNLSKIYIRLISHIRPFWVYFFPNTFDYRPLISTLKRSLFLSWTSSAFENNSTPEALN